MKLVINADDFGVRPGVDRAVISLAQLGLITSVSLLVKYPDYEYAADFLRDLPTIGAGLHLDLDHIFSDAGFGVDYQGRFLVPDIFFENEAVRELVRTEIRTQLDLFTEIGRVPDHVDGHRDVHLYLPVMRILLKELYSLGCGAIRFKPGFYDIVAARTSSVDLLNQFSMLSADKFVKGPQLPLANDAVLCEMAVNVSLDLPEEEPWRVRQYHTMIGPSFAQQLSGSGVELINFSALNEGQLTPQMSGLSLKTGDFQSAVS